MPAPKQTNLPVAYHAGRYYTADQFRATVWQWLTRLQAEPSPRYALYTEDAYPFAILLFALLHAGKEVWIPGNNRPGTAHQLIDQRCRLIGDWHNAGAFDFLLATPASAPALPALNPEQAQLVIFTSGSTGEAKPIAKRLIQLQKEALTLEKHWGAQLANAEVLATVSHQHIYGLLFRILWPLSAGRCFHSKLYLGPEVLIKACQHRSAFWVASPAHLKRLDQSIAGLSAIFCSGGPLSRQAAAQVLACSGQPVIEIFGSTESGGIAWRQQSGAAETAWTLFEGMTLSRKDGRWQLQSPYLLNRQSLTLDDQISLEADGRFMLQGRLDRIVKIEEKRLSLAEMEQRLLAMPWVDDTYVLTINKNRDLVAAAVVLSQAGTDLLSAKGRNYLIRQLRAALYYNFDAVVLPRKWLFLNSLPLTAQGKVESLLLKQLLDFDALKLPQVLGAEITAESVELQLKVPEDLLYFPDHFAGYPILPGVVQIAWSDHFGKLFFATDTPFFNMEVIKFVKVIRPGQELKLKLDWKAHAHKLYFQFSSTQGTHSSGRLVG